MPNTHRGEIAADLEGSARTLCLTLGALAELEEALGGEDVFALMKRFGEGHIRARDVACIVAAGLQGGEGMRHEEARALASSLSLREAAGLAAQLLTAAFGGEGGQETARPFAQAPFPGDP